MPPEARGSTDASAWLRRARSNLAKADPDPIPPDVLYEDLCFDAQQAAEKALKAVLVHRGLPFRKTHDIGYLLALLDDAGQDISEGLRVADILTSYAVETRYPGQGEPVTADEHRTAVELAAAVVHWAEHLIEARRPTPAKG